jgi:acyl-CoA synthetase (AMP-forming)/AMP-acid ligase II
VSNRVVAARAVNDVTLGDILREHRRSLPAHIAVVDGDVRLTYPQLDDRVNRLANAFLHAGVVNGDRVLWLGQNSFVILECLLAAAKLGAIFCPVNWRQSASELQFVIEDLDPRMIIWQDAEIGTTVREARALVSSSAQWVRQDGKVGDPDGYEQMAGSRSAEDPDSQVDPGEPVVILYTAAFDGRPNGAMLSHTTLLRQNTNLAMVQQLNSDYVYLNCGPLFHIGTLSQMLAAFHMGGRNVFTPRVDAVELCRLIDAEGCNNAFIMAPTVEQIAEVNKDGKYNLRTLQVYAGRAGQWRGMVREGTTPWHRWPAGYGQTEVAGIATYCAFAGDGARGPFGRPAPQVQVRIIDHEGDDVPLGEVGEIACRGVAMNGYWNRPELNAARQVGGWHRTNDLGRREVDGTISFVGPRTQMIKSAAENIYPAEVEGCIKTHPSVSDAAVIGVPDPTWVQNVKAIVVLRDGLVATAEEIIEHCRAHIASYKKPKLVEFVDEIPKKGFLPDYDELDARFGGGGYPGGASATSAVSSSPDTESSAL